jgi:hypothetical protein
MIQLSLPVILNTICCGYVTELHVATGIQVAAERERISKHWL